jgi:hypothetical protein
MPVTYIDPPIVKDLAKMGWGEQGVYIGGAANQLGLAERKRREDALRPIVTRTIATDRDAPVTYRAGLHSDAESRENPLAAPFRLAWYIFLAMWLFSLGFEAIEWLCRLIF